MHPPFPDGNGRMSRLLTLLLLYHFDYAVGRYISLERIFEETKEGYYETLEASSQGWHQGQHDVKPWLDYFWGIAAGLPRIRGACRHHRAYAAAKATGCARKL